MVKQNIWGLQYIDELVAVVNNPEFMTETTFDHKFDIDSAKIYMAAHDALFNIMGLFEFSRIYGDMDGDRDVDLDDINEVVDATIYETIPFKPKHDINKDGFYDADDYYLAAWSYFHDIKHGLGASGTIPAERYEYTPYGERQVYVSGRDQTGKTYDYNASLNGMSDTKAMSPVSRSQRVLESGGSSPVALCDIGFQGLVHDETTGLVQQRNRMNHTRLGRFMQRDPLGYVDGMSVYAAYFVMFELSDPLGLQGGKGSRCHGQGCIDMKPNPDYVECVSKCGGVSVRGRTRCRDKCRKNFPPEIPDFEPPGDTAACCGGQKKSRTIERWGSWKCCGDEQKGEWYKDPKGIGDIQCCKNGKLSPASGIYWKEAGYKSLNGCIASLAHADTLTGLVLGTGSQAAGTAANQMGKAASGMWKVLASRIALGSNAVGWTLTGVSWVAYYEAKGFCTRKVCEKN